MIIVSVCNLFETWLYTYDKFWERSKLQRENMESVYGEGVFSLFFAFVFVCFGKGGGLSIQIYEWELRFIKTQPLIKCLNELIINKQ